MIAALACSAALITSASAIDLFVDGSQLELDVEPQVVQQRTLVPLRAIFEKLGATVTWDQATQTARAVKGTDTVQITLNSTTAYVNGVAQTLDVPAMAIGGRTLVPVRFVSESLNADVWWEAETETVYVATTTNYDGYTLAPKAIYSTSAEENGLADTFMYADGIVTGSNMSGEYPTYTLRTGYGDITIIDGMNLVSDQLKAGNTYRVCFLYMGYSSVLDSATGMFFEVGDLSATPHKPVDTPPIPSMPIQTPAPTPAPTETPSTGHKIYVTKTGSKYHYDSSCNGGTYYESTLEEALARGLTPCAKCVGN
ncbi:MAG: copper amine oxidase N-terminal domain-containing protein [Oscillospiraceae bacterium]|nr:copper amine oxidase N-terminal domain-containing protein [Oscillospiraceae bacterium]